MSHEMSLPSQKYQYNLITINSTNCCLAIYSTTKYTVAYLEDQTNDSLLFAKMKWMMKLRSKRDNQSNTGLGI